MNVFCKKLIIYTIGMVIVAQPMATGGGGCDVSCSSDLAIQKENKMNKQQKAVIKLYTTDYCPYCVKAKDMLDNLGLKYEVIDVSNDQDLRIQLVELSGGRRTVPQVFIDDRSIGGYDDLKQLQDQGELDALVY